MQLINYFLLFLSLSPPFVYYLPKSLTRYLHYNLLETASINELLAEMPSLQIMSVLCVLFRIISCNLNTAWGYLSTKHTELIVIFCARWEMLVIVLILQNSFWQQLDLWLQHIQSLLSPHFPTFGSSGGGQDQCLLQLSFRAGQLSSKVPQFRLWQWMSLYKYGLACNTSRSFLFFMHQYIGIK